MRENTESRKFVILAMFILAGIVMTAKLFQVQILNKDYKLLAESNVIRKINTYPARGLVYDRNNKLIIANDAVYDIKVIPKEVAEFDTLLLCQLLELEPEVLNAQLDKAKKYSFYKPSPVVNQIPAETYARLQESLYEFPGFFAEVRTIRNYPYNCAANFLGYIGEVSKRDLAKDEEGYYKQGDYIGISGIEKSYESFLRGLRGVKYVLTDKFNRNVGSYLGGDYDTLAIAGQNLTTTVDIELQQYGEELMKNKLGSVVAIEPKTGEVLALVSSPSYNPNLLTGRQRGSEFALLSEDSLKPLFVRPLMATYPPGSTFKPLVALIAMQEGAIWPNFSYSCPGYYRIPGRTLRCSHDHDPAYNVQEAIRHSCNPYFWQSFKNSLDQSDYNSIQETYNHWTNYLESFGLGIKNSVDLPNEQTGNVPSADYYDKVYGKKGWASSTVISLGIGQGELLLTPLQMANMTAIIANKGHFIYPHLIRPSAEEKNSIYLQKQEIPIDKKYFDVVIEGLERVVEKGTGKNAKIDSIRVGGKTGTAQNPHGEDHSLFIAFAPIEDPQIAIAVVVENGGYGSRYGAPIASLMIEKYLKGKISNRKKWWEEKMFTANLIEEE